MRFRTDAKSITIRAKLDPADYNGNSNVLLRRNFDLYKKQGNRVVFETTFVHNLDPNFLKINLIFAIKKYVKFW